VRNTDLVIAADDENCMNIIRLFNEPFGRKYLQKQGLPKELTDKLDLIGISGVGNILCSIKFAKYYELTGRDIVLTVLTDSMELYGSRIRELREQFGEYTELDAARDYHRYLMALTTDRMLELNFYDRKRVHNLKYYTWIEQQGRELSELNDQWYRFPEYWEKVHAQVDQIDELITEFNERTGLLKKL
jgi:cysteine synthase